MVILWILLRQDTGDHFHHIQMALPGCMMKWGPVAEFPTSDHWRVLVALQVVQVKVDHIDMMSDDYYNMKKLPKNYHQVALHKLY